MQVFPTFNSIEGAYPLKYYEFLTAPTKMGCCVLLMIPHRVIKGTGNIEKPILNYLWLSKNFLSERPNMIPCN